MPFNCKPQSCILAPHLLDTTHQGAILKFMQSCIHVQPMNDQLDTKTCFHVCETGFNTQKEKITFWSIPLRTLTLRKDGMQLMLTHSLIISLFFMLYSQLRLSSHMKLFDTVQKALHHNGTFHTRFTINICAGAKVLLSI